MMITLMACYGAGYYDDYPPDEPCTDGYGSYECEEPEPPAPGCGNGVIDPLEQCDDGNLYGGDGCDAGCRLELCATAQPLAGAEIVGDTVAGNARFHVDCEGYHGFGRERIYAFEAPQAGTLEVEIEGGGTLGVYVTATCSAVASVDATDAAGAAACTGPAPQGPTTLSAAVTPGTKWIVIDGANPGDAGAPFVLRTRFEPACGNGALDEWAGETCDDGNRESADGCDASCHPEAQVVCDAAADLALGVTEGDTTGGSQAVACGDRERLYRFVAPADGTLSLIASGATDVALSIMTGCAPAQAACVDEQPAMAPEVVSRFLTGGEELWIAVDTPPGEAGPFTIQASFTPQ